MGAPQIQTVCPLPILALALVSGCEFITDLPKVMPPQTAVLFSTRQMIKDFDHPSADARAFLEHYAALTANAEKTILIFAVGNSEHILTYQHIAGIVTTFKVVADTLGINLKVFDQVAGCIEFGREYFKLNYHPVCFSRSSIPSTSATSWVWAPPRRQLSPPRTCGPR